MRVRIKLRQSWWQFYLPKYIELDTLDFPRQERAALIPDSAEFSVEVEDEASYNPDDDSGVVVIEPIQLTKARAEQREYLRKVQPPTP